MEIVLLLLITHSRSLYLSSFLFLVYLFSIIVCRIFSGFSRGNDSDTITIAHHLVPFFFLFVWSASRWQHSSNSTLSPTTTTTTTNISSSCIYPSAKPTTPHPSETSRILTRKRKEQRAVLNEAVRAFLTPHQKRTAVICKQVTYHTCGNAPVPISIATVAFAYGTQSGCCTHTPRPPRLVVSCFLFCFDEN